MQLKWIQALFVLMLLFSGYGCATVINGTTQKIPIATEPTGADCIVAGDSTRYTTPCTVELKRKQDHILNLSKDGYHSESVEIKHTMSGAVVGNVLVGGIIGIGVDAASGAACKLIPETVNITMKALPKQEPVAEVQPAPTPVPEELKAKSREQELDELVQLKKEKKISKKEYKTARENILNGQ
jgi:hypothetical protein